MAIAFATALAAALPASATWAQPTTPSVGAHGAMTPATWAGEHAGAFWRLDLWPDQAFPLARRLGSGGADRGAGDNGGAGDRLPDAAAAR